MHTFIKLIPFVPSDITVSGKYLIVTDKGHGTGMFCTDVVVKIEDGDKKVSVDCANQTIRYISEDTVL